MMMIRTSHNDFDSQCWLVRSDIRSIMRHWNSIEKIIRESSRDPEYELSEEFVRAFWDGDSEFVKTAGRLETLVIRIQLDAAPYGPTGGFSRSDCLPDDIF